MRIDSEKYGGLCACGAEHTMETRLCVIEAGALADTEKYLSELGLVGRKRCAV